MHEKMDTARKKFVLYAALCAFAVLALLLGTINCVTFTMAAQDADVLTLNLSKDTPLHLEGDEGQAQASSQPAFPPRMGPMGPDSPEMRDSLRFFTASFDKEGNGEVTRLRLSAVDGEEALAWAKSLSGKSETGWTRGTYRYRVTRQGKKTTVTVVDQGRELISCYRILIISAIGLIAGTAVSFLILRLAAKRLFAPVEEADRQQKRFLARAEEAFRLPLTVIRADAELIEKAHGPDESTRSIHRQARRMAHLVESLGALTASGTGENPKAPVDLSELIQMVLDESAPRFEARGIELTRHIQEGAVFSGDGEALARAFEELTENALRYARGSFSVTLSKTDARIRILFENPAALPDGGAEAAFDRFAKLANGEADSAGLGLSYVRDIVLAQGGRATAQVEKGVFRLRIDL